jgi:hypothetical protein
VSVIPAPSRNIKYEDNSPGQPGQKVRPYLQFNQSKNGWRLGQAVEHLPGKCKVLSSNPSNKKTDRTILKPQCR